MENHFNEKPDIPTLLRHRSDIWQGEAASSTLRRISISSGFPALDEVLGGGWPMGQITEIFPDSPGPALRLLLPVLKKCSTAENWLTWIAPPLLPYPPGLLHHGIALEYLLVVRPNSTKERLWAAEQCLRSNACSAVLLWLEQSNFQISRRLQLAAQESKAPIFCLLPPDTQYNASAAAQRLAVRPHHHPGIGKPNSRRDNPMELVVEILKCRGVGGSRRLHLSTAN